MKTLLATVIAALLLTTTAQAGQEYSCERIDFDTQECEYTGTTTIEDVQESFIGQNIFVFKVPFVGTLNLCLEMPDTE